MGLSCLRCMLASIQLGFHASCSCLLKEEAYQDNILQELSSLCDLFGEKLGGLKSTVWSIPNLEDFLRNVMYSLNSSSKTARSMSQLGWPKRQSGDYRNELLVNERSD